jgi:hypothetical protein
MTADEARRWDEWQRVSAESGRRTDMHVRIVGVAILAAAVINLAIAVWMR